MNWFKRTTYFSLAVCVVFSTLVCCCAVSDSSASEVKAPPSCHTPVDNATKADTSDVNVMVGCDMFNGIVNDHLTLELSLMQVAVEPAIFTLSFAIEPISSISYHKQRLKLSAVPLYKINSVYRI
jgi:hypothetical protein